MAFLMAVQFIHWNLADSRLEADIEASDRSVGHFYDTYLSWFFNGASFCTRVFLVLVGPNILTKCTGAWFVWPDQRVVLIEFAITPNDFSMHDR